jgi:hypothetical protein
MKYLLITLLLSGCVAGAQLVTHNFETKTGEVKVKLEKKNANIALADFLNKVIPCKSYKLVGSSLPFKDGALDMSAVQAHKGTGLIHGTVQYRCE